MNPAQSKPEVVVPPHLYGVPTNAFASETSLLTLSDVDDVSLLEDDEVLEETFLILCLSLFLSLSTLGRHRLNLILSRLSF